MNFDCGIYAITSPSGKQYIGQAQSFKKRWLEHIYWLRRGEHHCVALQNAFKKYGEQSLVFSKVAIAPKEDLNFREQEQIDERPRHMLYNIALDVVATMRGRRHKQSTIEKIRLANTGESSPHFGKRRGEETRAKMSAARKGKIFTLETRHKMSIAQRGERCKKSKPVVCVETGQVFPSSVSAAQWLRTSGYPKAAKQNIHYVCIGKMKIAYGHTWQYATPRD